MIFRFVLLTALFFVFCEPAQALVCNNNYSVKGKLKVLNDAYNPDPYYEGLAGIKVRIYNGLFHIQTTYTNSQGEFLKSWKSCSKKLNLKIAFVPTTSKVNVSQLMLPNHFKIRPSKNFKKARPGTYDFGTLLYGKKETRNVHILKVFQSTKEILSWLDQWHNIDFFKDAPIDSGAVQMGYPSLTPNDTSWYTPATGQINLKERDFQPRTPYADILAHEFGHLFHNSYGRWYLNIPGYNGDAGWSLGSDEPPATANLEGFALFFEYLFMLEHDFNHYETIIENKWVKPHLAEGGATNHASFFYDLFDANQDEDENCHVDRCELPLEEIMNVFAAHSHLNLKAFSIANSAMDEFIDRYYKIYGNPPGQCDFDELLYLNALKENPDGDSCEQSEPNVPILDKIRQKRKVPGSFRPQRLLKI